MRLEKAVGDKIGEIIARDSDGSLGATTGQLTGIGIGPHDNVRGNSNSKTDGIAKAQPGQCQQLQIQIHPPPKFRCALGHPTGTHSSNNKPAAVFQPAAALAPGEDWRPPIIAGDLQPAGNSLNQKTAKDTITQDTTTGICIAPTGSSSSSSWAADEVSRREEIKRRAVAAAGPAPEADMEISPTLGRWRRHSLGIGGGLPVEDLGANVVEVAGLRFAVDLCATSTFGGGAAGGGGAGNRGLGAKTVEDGARLLML